MKITCLCKLSWESIWLLEYLMVIQKGGVSYSFDPVNVFEWFQNLKKEGGGSVANHWDYANDAHDHSKTSQIANTTNDILHLKLNASGAVSLKMLAFLVGAAAAFYYSPRDLAPHVINSETCMPGVVVPRKANRNLNKLKVKVGNSEKKGTLRKALLEDDKWLRKRLKKKFS